ncbi:MAG: hypothetical protein IJ542_00715 [Clostridia bacterium]|nr:hypothetical protein [Clostridia bacterium]
MDNFLLVFEDISALNELLLNYEKVHVFFDDKVSQENKQFVLSALSKKCVFKSYFPNAIATIGLSDRVRFSGEELVLAVGGLQLQSLAKYYAMSVGVDYALVPAFEVAEYSFSQYAFVKDKYFCFYECKKPKFVFVAKRFFDDVSIKKLKSALTYKNIVQFEKEFETDILQNEKSNLDKIVKCVNLCDDKLFSIIKVYGICASLLSKQKTYLFLGNEYVVLSLYAGENLLDDLLLVDSMLFKLYECVIKFSPIDKQPELNKHVFLLKQDFNVSSLQSSAAVSAFSVEDKREISGRLHAYIPFLKTYFSNSSMRFVPGKFDFSAKKLERALALSSGLFLRKNLIRYLRDFGYFENLI